MKKYVVRLDRANPQSQTLYLAIDNATLNLVFKGLPTLFNSQSEAKTFMDHPQFNGAFLDASENWDVCNIYYREA